MNDSEFGMIDLFSGAGGLSLGLHSAGFSPWLAVDASDMAAETYFRNFVSSSQGEWDRHLNKPLSAQIAAGVGVASTEAVLAELDAVKRTVNGREIALVAGGPPCQGFSLAGLRNPDDQRNRLPFEFLRFVRELRPKAVLIENVTGIGARFSSTEPSALEELGAALAVTGSDGYLTQILELDASHYGVPQRRPRIMIAALRGDIASRFSVNATDDIATLLSSPRWSSGSRNTEPPLLAPHNFGSSRTVGEALGDLTDDGYLYSNPDQYPPDLEFAKRLRLGSDFPTVSSDDELSASGRPANHTLRKHGPRVRARFALFLALAPYSIRENLFSLAMYQKADVRATLTTIREILEINHVPEPLTMPHGGAIRDASGTDVGVNHAALTYAIAALATGKHSQRALREDQPAPTVLSLPDDFVHPRRARTLSVREMARLQSFPDTFRFYGNETTGAHRRRIEVPQYTQVGNAVPPLLSKAMGQHLKGLLGRSAELTQLSSTGR